MATRSFYEDLILDTPEAVANMEKAYNSNVTWTHYDGLGNEIKDNTTSVTALKYSVALVTAENRDTKTYYVYQGTAPTDADDIAADMVAGIDITDADEVKAVVQYALDNSLNSNEFEKALDAAGADKALIVETFMDVYSDGGYENANVIKELVANLAEDLDDAKEVMDAYLSWLAAELEADGSSVTNRCGLTIEQTADGWAIDFTTAPASGSTIDNSGLGGLSEALATKFGADYTVSATWADQNGAQGSAADATTKDWTGEMTNILTKGYTYDITFTFTETADPSNTMDFNVTLG